MEARNGRWRPRSHAYRACSPREDRIMPRRRSWEGAGEPLFGEDWWREDQKLFQDSLARTAATARKSRPRRAARRAAQPGTLPDGHAQDALFSYDDIAAIQGAEHEPVRPDGPEALGAVAARPVRPDRGPGQLLLGLGEVNGGEDRQPGAGSGGRRPARGGVPRQSRSAGPGAAPGGGDRAGRPDPARTGTRSGRGTRGPGRSRTGSPPAPQQLAAFRPEGQQDLAPSGAVSRVHANLAALATLRTIQRETRPATVTDQRVLARWSGWGAVPEVFDTTRQQFAWAREHLSGLLTEQELAAAARSTINAHYTDAALVQAMWAAAGQLGFDGGHVLEPGCGSGNFIGFAPSSVHMTGVELEPVTAAIAAALYPGATIIPGSFAGTRTPADSFDLVIGNVPFGQVTLHDPRHNRAGHSIHNHFIIKSLHLTCPGGLVMVLTSRYTMDARNPAARREIASLADLAGALLLSSGAHQRAAGTSVVTDLLILRRREPGRQPAATAWEQARMTELDGAQVAVNEYFLDHPEAVLGELGAINGAYRADDLVVTATGDTIAAFTLFMKHAATDARARSLAWTPAIADKSRPEPAPPSQHPDGYLQARDDGTFTEVADGAARPYEVPRSQAAELRALLGLRDTAVRLLEIEASAPEETPDTERLRAELGRRYDSYARTYGPLNRFSVRRTGRTDAVTGQEKTARVRPPQGGFRGDPYAPLVYALEDFDPAGQRAAKAAIFTHRVVAPRAPRLGADIAADALAICLDTCGEPRLDEIARLLGVSDDQARADLGALVFDDPASARLVPVAEYLSGNVRDKLRAAA